MKKNRQLYLSIIIVFLSLSIGLLLAAIANDQDISITTKQLFQSLAMTLVTVPIVLLVLKKLDKIPLKNLFKESPLKSLGKFCMGAGLILIPLILHFGISLSLGWVKPVNPIDASVLLSILGAMAYSFFFEAFPEELALRGYIFGRLNGAMVKWKAFMLTLAIFILLPVFTSFFQWMVLGINTEFLNAIRFEYLATIFIMGTVIQLVRVSFNSFWAGMGFHFAFLLSDRIIGTGKRHNIQLEIVGENTSEGPLLILWLIIIVLLVAFYPKLRKRTWGWKDHDEQLRNLCGYSDYKKSKHIKSNENKM